MNRFFQIFKVPDLRKKILIVAGLLVAYRVLAAVPIPGVDAARLQNYFGSSQLFGFLSFFSGGGLSNLSLVMLGRGPLHHGDDHHAAPHDHLPAAEGDVLRGGRARPGEVQPVVAAASRCRLAFVQAYGFLTLLISQGVIDRPDPFSLVRNVIVIACGSMIALWLGELITEQKVGNGISLIILAGILARLPSATATAFATYTPGLLATYSDSPSWRSCSSPASYI